MADLKMKKNSETDVESQEIDDLFEGVEGTIVVSVHRLEPEYAEGFCGKFNVTSGRTLSLHEVKERFGGRVFRLTARDSGGKYVKRKMITISSQPLDEGRLINKDGSLGPDPTKETTQNGNFDYLSIVNMYPKHMQPRIAAAMMGIDLTPSPPVEKKESPIDVVTMQMLMKMQSDMDESSLRRQKLAMDMEKDLITWRREMTGPDANKTTLSGVDNLVDVFTKMQRLKDEFGGGTVSPVNTIVQTAIPMLETVVSELMSLKKTQMQIAAAQSSVNLGPAPALESRTTKAPSYSPVRVALPPEHEDPVQLAARMGTIFAKLDENKRQKAMVAFFQAQQNIEVAPNDDTIDSTDNDLLDDSVRELLANESEKSNADDFIQDGGHTRSTDDHDSDYWKGDSGGFTVSTDPASCGADNEDSASEEL